MRSHHVSHITLTVAAGQRCIFCTRPVKSDSWSFSRRVLCQILCQRKRRKRGGAAALDSSARYFSRALGIACSPPASWSPVPGKKEARLACPHRLPPNTLIQGIWGSTASAKIAHPKVPDALSPKSCPWLCGLELQWGLADGRKWLWLKKPEFQNGLPW